MKNFRSITTLFNLVLSLGFTCGIASAQNQICISDEADYPQNIPCQGMPVWSVSEPFINLWIQDEPLGYSPATGPRVGFQLFFKQRADNLGGQRYQSSVFSVGKGWNASWISMIDKTYRILHLPGGGAWTYPTNNLPATNYLNNTRLSALTNGSGATIGFELRYPNGAKDVYDWPRGTDAASATQFFLKQKTDATGRALTFNYHPYDGNVRLKEVVDAENRTSTVSYVSSHSYSTTLISQISDPFGRSAQFYYDEAGYLTNVVDVASNSSTFGYHETTRWITNMTTPYGMTAFRFVDNTNSLVPDGRAVDVAEANGSHQLFLHRDNVSSVLTNVVAPSTTNSNFSFPNQFEQAPYDDRNSFHWNRQQYASLSTTNSANLTSDDYATATLKHWLKEAVTPTGYAGHVARTLSIERGARPSTNEQASITWHDYEGKPAPDTVGSQILPLFVADVLTDGATGFVRTERNSVGNPTTAVETYTKPDGSVDDRTDQFEYSSDGVDLLRHYDVNNDLVSSNLFNGFHQIIENYNVLNEKTTFQYDSVTRQLTNTIFPSQLNQRLVYYDSTTDIHHRGYIGLVPNTHFFDLCRKLYRKLCRFPAEKRSFRLSFRQSFRQRSKGPGFWDRL